MTEYNWIPRYGIFEHKKNEIVFKGGINPGTDKNIEYAKMGMNISDQKFSEGIVETSIKFSTISKDYPQACCIVFNFNAENESFIAAGFNMFPKINSAFAIFNFDPTATVNKWNFFSQSGEKNNVLPKVEYGLKIILTGSRLDFFINNVNILTHYFPFLIPKKQVGLWCQSPRDIMIHDFIVEEKKGKTFVIMEYSKKYNDLYDEVIKPVCKGKNIETIRADESEKTGLILRDIVNRIYESKFIIAEITPRNPNVYFEIGYAIAIGKPVVFIADKNNEEGLPFDISGFRVLFYENTISGKSKIEEELSKHVDAILLD